MCYYSLFVLFGTGELLMKIFYDFLPIVLFFVSYKIWGIYVATGVAILASILQVSGYWLKFRKTENMQLITLFVVVFLGGATLLLKDELFIKWKPTIIYWAFGLAFSISHFFGKRNLIQRLMDNKLHLPKPAWNRLNMAWSIFFIILGFINLYVLYNFSTDTWVNFKLFGTLILMIVFVLLQSIYMARHINEPHHNQQRVLDQGNK